MTTPAPIQRDYFPTLFKCPKKFEYFLDTTINREKGTIQQDIRDATDIIQRNIMNTRDAETVKALIKLGWTPPPEQPKQ